MSSSIFNQNLKNQTKFFDKTFNEFVEERGFETDGDITFDKCIFKNFAIFENLNAREFLFSNCTFEKGLYIGKSNFHSISFFFSKTQDVDLVLNTSDSLSFRKFKSEKLNINGNYTSIQFVSSNIDDVTINEVNNIHNYKDSKISFLVENNFKNLNLKSLTLYSEIFFIGGNYKSVFFEGEFKKRICFSGDLEIENLHFESSNFQNRIDFEEGNFKYVNLYRSTFYGLVYVNDTNYSELIPRDLTIKHLSLHSCNFAKDITIQLNEIEDFSSSNCNFNEVLNINSFNDEISKLLLIRFDGINQGNIVIERSYADITLSGVNFSNIFFKDLNISTFFMLDYQNNGFISFSDIKTGQYFVIQNSISGKMNFLNTNINLFKEIIIANSELDGVNFKKYPQKILSESKKKIAGYGIKQKSLKVSNLKDVYNQLKKIAKNKGDIDTANRFESLELRQLLYSKEISFDSFLLFLNYISNNNGSSWVRGVLFTLIVGFLFFILYLKTIGIKFNFNQCYQDYILFISSFPKLELKSYSLLNENWKTQLVIWLSRIFISYGIYQTVAAFRKYGKN